MGENINEILLALFDRPNEPLFLPKGDEQFKFHMPEDFLENRFKNTQISDRFGGNDVVDLKPINLPNLNLPLQLDRNEQFTPFIPEHRKMAGQLIENFLGMKSTTDFLSCAAFCRQNMNPLLFNYAFSVALLHREDTKGFDVPPLHEFFPDRFIDYGIFSRARMEANISSAVEEIQAEPIEVPMDYTASDLDIEHRVAYFREDIGVNLHHWHWHLVYPILGPRQVVAKDRRGELFYFMHQQINARYNFERLCNMLPRVKKLIDLRAPIPEAYFPKLDSLTSSRVWASRSPNSFLQDVNRENLNFDIQDLERWRDRLYEAVSTGRVINLQGQSIPLTEENGIDILGNLVESSNLSLNRNLYGDLHNLGHMAISLAHDPENKYLERFTVLGDSSTAMRDPVFYRWHAFIDDIFAKYKQTLTPYTVQQLGFDGIKINSIEVNSKSSPKNQFSTFWQQSDVNLTKGMDFLPRDDVFARITHLQHQPFEYKIKVTNSGKQRQGTVRIFLAPKFDERGVPYLFNDERKMMIEVDRFVHNFKQQSDTIIRKSRNSSLIIPFERTFRNLDTAPTSTVPGSGDAFNFCGCGWPEHMMIPKGTSEGMQSTLFVMVSDYQFDKVDGQPSGRKSQSGCEPAMIYCGIRDQKYPDARPMGFPFDRIGRDGVTTLAEFLTPNMLTQDVTIKFSNAIVPPGTVSR